MSIKIYNGFKLTLADMNYDTLLKWINYVKKEVCEIQQRIFNEEISRQFYSKYDNCDFSIEKKDILQEIVDRIEKQLPKMREKGYRHWSTDTDFSFSIVPFENSYYLIIYSDNVELINVISKDKSIESFDYWDNSDEPDGMSDEEWSHREDIWSSVFKQYKKTANDLGLNIEINILLENLDWNSIKSFIEYYSLEKRTKDVARNRYCQIYIENNLIRFPDHVDSEESYNDISQSLFAEAAVKYMALSENEKLLEFRKFNLNYIKLDSTVKLNEGDKYNFCIIDEIEKINKTQDVLDKFINSFESVKSELSLMLSKELSLKNIDKYDLAEKLWFQQVHVVIFEEDYKYKIALMCKENQYANSLYNFNVKNIKPLYIKHIELDKIALYL